MSTICSLTLALALALVAQDTYRPPVLDPGDTAVFRLVNSIDRTQFVLTDRDAYRAWEDAAFPDVDTGKVHELVQAKRMLFLPYDTEFLVVGRHNDLRHPAYEAKITSEGPFKGRKVWVWRVYLKPKPARREPTSG